MPANFKLSKANNKYRWENKFHIKRFMKINEVKHGLKLIDERESHQKQSTLFLGYLATTGSKPVNRHSNRLCNRTSKNPSKKFTNFRQAFFLPPNSKLSKWVVKVYLPKVFFPMVVVSGLASWFNMWTVERDMIQLVHAAQILHAEFYCCLLLCIPLVSTTCVLAQMIW